MKIIADIAHGGFGKVQSAIDSNGRKVILKIFDPIPQILAVSPRGTLLKRFSREVRIQQSLPDLYFVPILESNIDNDPPWFTMPVADRDFQQEILDYRKVGIVPTNAISEIINALEKLHSLGFTHRDLKPSNILKHDGRWKLSDFGLVLPDAGITSTLTSTNSAWGSAPWCAPEQAADFKHVTSAADIYSFGAILHDIFTDGRRIPYRQQTCPGPIGTIIEKCTEFNPRKRFKTMSAVRDALFKVIVNPTVSSVSADAKTWLERLPGIYSWEDHTVDDFIRFISKQAEHNDKFVIFTEVDENLLEKCRNRDEDLWNTVVLEYCSWCYGQFDFEYCDILIGRLRYIYNHGSTELQASAIMAAENLGESHNRWHVMGHLLEMCSPKMNDELAQRVAIEILAQDAQQIFRRCAEGISRSSDAYHPQIRELI